MVENIVLVYEVGCIKFDWNIARICLVKYAENLHIAEDCNRNKTEYNTNSSLYGAKRTDWLKFNVSVSKNGTQLQKRRIVAMEGRYDHTVITLI